MTMTTRDPRTDPRPGDVLEVGAPFNPIRIVRVDSVDDDVIRFIYLAESALHMKCTKQEWPRMTMVETAIILRVADMTARAEEV